MLPHKSPFPAPLLGGRQVVKDQPAKELAGIVRKIDLSAQPWKLRAQWPRG